MVRISQVSEGRLRTVVEFDATLSEAHSHTAKATEFPVETGATISDHVVQMPDAVKLEGVVSNTPLPSNVQRDRDMFEQEARAGAYAERGEDAYRALLEAKEAGTLLTVETDLRSYADLVVESVEPAKEGDGLRLTIALKKITTSTTKTVPVPKIEKAAPKVKKGRQPTATAAPGGPTDSVARAAAEKLKGFFAP